MQLLLCLEFKWHPFTAASSTSCRDLIKQISPYGRSRFSHSSIINLKNNEVSFINLNSAYLCNSRLFF